MGNLCNTCRLYSKKQKNITILLTGLDNAGKTTIAKTLVGESIDSVLKTIGFSLVEMKYHGFKITIYDLGGSSNIRDIWNKYYMDAHGLIYVVDASDSVRFEESKQIFADLLSHENISGKHILLLAHKQDKQALDELEIVEYLNVEYIVNKYRCPTRVEPSTVIGLESSKMDKGLKNGFKWLMDNIIRDYKIINERVLQDMANYSVLVEKNREEWRNKMKARADSPAAIPAEENGNPFQPIGSVVNEGTKKNEILVKPVMVDNFIREPAQVSNCSRKTAINSENTLVSTVTQPIKGQKSKLKQRFRKHRKKFGRFNKTAPMPIDMMIQGKSEAETENTFQLAVRSYVQYTETSTQIPRNYLIRRPATAPAKISSFKLKVESTWNLSAPLGSSRSRKSPDDEDIVSYF